MYWSNAKIALFSPPPPKKKKKKKKLSQLSVTFILILLAHSKVSWILSKNLISWSLQQFANYPGLKTVEITKILYPWNFSINTLTLKT